MKNGRLSYQAKNKKGLVSLKMIKYKKFEGSHKCRKSLPTHALARIKRNFDGIYTVISIYSHYTRKTTIFQRVCFWEWFVLILGSEKNQQAVEIITFRIGYHPPKLKRVKNKDFLYILLLFWEHFFIIFFFIIIFYKYLKKYKKRNNGYS